jgi:hypothetical protein
MRKFRILIFSFILMFFYTSSTARELNDKVVISLLIASPNQEKIVSSYGHALLRVQNPELNIDYVVNYGIFDPSITGSQAIFGILRSKLKSEIWVIPFAEYYKETMKDKRVLIEHTFNFSSEEKKTIWQNLISTIKDKDRIYTFDFFTQNCTTFVRDFITNNLGSQIALPQYLGQKTFRDINLRYTKNNLWHVFTLDLLFGNEWENRVPAYQSLYEPTELESAWTKSYIIDGNGNKKLLFASSSVLINGKESKETRTPFVLSPLFFSILFLLVILCVSLLEWGNKCHYNGFDIALFGLTGILGIIFYLFKFACSQWYVLMDWDMLWLHPFHLLVVLFIIKSFNKSLVVYHSINALLLCILIIGMFFFASHYNEAIAVFTVGLSVRSIAFLSRETQQHFSRTI